MTRRCPAPESSSPIGSKCWAERFLFAPLPRVISWRRYPLADGSFRSDTAVNVYALGASDFPQQKKFVGFDFETVWQISGTYPTLRALT